MLSPNIPLVNSIPNIEELSVDTLFNTIPGFQVSEEFVAINGIKAVLDVISMQVVKHYPDFKFNSILTSHYSVNAAAHVDSSTWSGLALHHNISGQGEVALALPTWSAEKLSGSGRSDYTKALSRGNPNDLANTELDLIQRPIYSGKLKPDRLTIFSEGIDKRTLPTAHFFRHDHQGRQWERFSYKPSS